VTQPIIIPKWLYERFVIAVGKEQADQHMSKWNAVAVGDWREAVDLEAVKARVNHG
jgi:hypothetical protein